METMVNNLTAGRSRMKTSRYFWLACIGLAGLVGCRGKEAIDTSKYDRQLPPGQLALRKLTNPSDIPDFSLAGENLDHLRIAIANSLNYFSKPSSQAFYPYGEIRHEQAVASLRAFTELLDSGLRGEELNNAIREKFDVYISVGCDDHGTVLFTGYYTPVFNGSEQPGGQFRYPLYQQPDDLVKGENGEIKGRKLPDGSIVQYPSRAEIEQTKMLAGKELVWLSNPFEAYVAHVQGSAKIRLPDGKIITIGYAANNGHEYKSIRQELIDDKKIPAEKMSLEAMIDYFKKHPEDAETYIQRNPRYVFFRLEQGQPRGSLNEPVIAYRSIATDKSIYPRGCLAFLTTKLPQVKGTRIQVSQFDGFVLDQDTGGAIRAPGRCDVYMGQGKLAGRLAGQTTQEGQLYYLFLKPSLVGTPVMKRAASAPEAEFPAAPPAEPSGDAEPSEEK